MTTAQPLLLAPARILYMINARGFRATVMSAMFVLVGGTLFTTQTAQARHGDRVDFKAFRQQNPEARRPDLRRMFNAERKGQALGRMADPGSTGFSPYGEGIVHCGTVAPQVDRVRNQSIQLNDSGRQIRLNAGVDLDLNSVDKNITLGKNLFASGERVTINVGGESRTVEAGSQVSAAEYVAVKQVLSGSQKISIDESGRAVGGEVDLGALTASNDTMRAASLVVAENVTTYGDFGKRSEFRLLGDLDNFGTVHVLTSDDNARGGAIGAHDITNHAGALISSDVDLTLEASNNLTNEGTISTVGSLSLSVGGAINNHGTISSRQGNVNLASPGDINVNNANGTISAVNGAINVRSADYDGSFNSTISGGDLLSRELNLNSGNGLASVAVNQLTGVVNESGNAAHVLAATDVLNIGSVCLSGDPTFYNSSGSINITANISNASEDIVIAAANNITSAGGITIQAGNTSAGFNITLIAGAEIIPQGGADSPTIPPGSPGGISLTGKASSTGGSILLGTDFVLARSSDYGAGNDDGANVAMYAFAGKQAGSGVIDIKDATVATHGFGTGSNGNIVLIAGAANTNSILTGQINSFGGTASRGNLIVRTCQPVSSAKGETVDYAADGSLTSTAFLTGSEKLSKNANVVQVAGGGGGGITNLSGDGVYDVSGNMSALGQIQTTNSSGLSFNVGGDMTSGAVPITAGSIVIVADGNIGTDAVALETSTNLIGITAFGPLANVNVQGAGVLDVSTASAGTDLRISSPNRVMSQTPQGEGFFAKQSVDMTALDFGPFDVFAIDTIAITTLDSGGTVFNGQFFGTNNLILDIAGGIGTNGTPFEISGVDFLSATSDGAGKSVFVSNIGKKDAVIEAFADTQAVIRSVAAVTVADVDVDNGSLTVEGGDKTLTFDGEVTAATTISIANQGAKGKIFFEADTDITTASGNINITVGPAGLPADNPGPFENIVIQEAGGGQVIINGPGFKADAPDNVLSGKGANLTINNGLKTSNIGFGGNVFIEADPPVAPGSPVFTLAGPVVDHARTGAPPTARLVDQASDLSGSPDHAVFATQLEPRPVAVYDSILNLATFNEQLMELDSIFDHHRKR